MSNVGPLIFIQMLKYLGTEMFVQGKMLPTYKKKKKL